MCSTGEEACWELAEYPVSQLSWLVYDLTLMMSGLLSFEQGWQ